MNVVPADLIILGVCIHLTITDCDRIVRWYSPVATDRLSVYEDCKCLTEMEPYVLIKLTKTYLLNSLTASLVNQPDRVHKAGRNGQLMSQRKHVSDYLLIS